MFVDLRNSCSEVGSYQELPALNFGLDDDEPEVGLRVHVAGHDFHFFDLSLDAVSYAFYQPVFRPSVESISMGRSTRWEEGYTAKVLPLRVH